MLALVQRLNNGRPSLFIDKAPSISLACLAMSFAGVKGGEEPVTEETFSYHAFPAANKFCHPLEILTRSETKLPLHLVEQLQSISVKAVRIVAR